MTIKSTDLQPTLADAFDIGKREGQKETLTEIKNVLSMGGVSVPMLEKYLEGRLKTIHDLSISNPFKQKD